MIRGDRFLLEEATHGSVDVYARTRAGSKSMVKGGGGVVEVARRRQSSVDE